MYTLTKLGTLDNPMSHAILILSFSLHVAFYGPLKFADLLIKYCAKVMIVKFIELHCFSILSIELNKFSSKMIHFDEIFAKYCGYYCSYP